MLLNKKEYKKFIFYFFFIQFSLVIYNNKIEGKDKLDSTFELTIEIIKLSFIIFSVFSFIEILNPHSL